jgi:leucyl/phenylalanyl-tRNA--protein transferase
MPKNIWIYLPKESYLFPHPNTADKQGLLAMGGDLSSDRLIQAYSQGIFPWFEPGCPILWWSPNPRLILIPSEFKVSSSLEKSLKKAFHFTIDTVFEKVITACATSSNRLNNTWISKEMIEAYTILHKQGYAHSFEIWQGNQLVGGLYGVSLGNVFFGESMFHTVTDASKVALYYLCQTMQAWHFDLIDCQLPSKHLHSLGAKIIGREEFLYLLDLALEHPTKQGLWNL